ncbi:MAG: methyl-accepting chemotaxis protein [Candidatus Cloacimonetes bacterium]|nr:methyl-accepting chemotaxis protein [Candidatus Cloacimonadota bacterium]
MASKLESDIKNSYRYFEDYFGELTLKSGKLLDGNGNIIGSDHEFVDNILEEYNNLTTVFVRSGDDFMRISTNIMTKNGERAIGTYLGKDSAAYNSIIDGKLFIGNAEILGKSYMTAYKPIIKDNNIIAVFFIGLSNEEAKLKIAKYINNLASNIIAITIFGMIFCLSVFYYSTVMITKPIKTITECLNDMAGFNFTPEVTGKIKIYMKNKSEIGIMSNNLQNMRETIQNLIIPLNKYAETLSDSSETMQEMSSTQNSAAYNLSRDVKSAENNTNITSASVQEITSGVEEISASARDISQASQEISAEIEKAAEITSFGLKLMDEATENISETERQTINTAEIAAELSKNAQNVGEIINTISSIAEQTNLLALNAAIEAARAGEAGKGFAVVADEIRKLAEESKKATADIGNILSEITGSVDKADKATDYTVQLVQKVSENGKLISAQFYSISKNVDQISKSIVVLSSTSEEQSVATEDIGRAMDESTRSTVNIVEQLEAISENASLQSKTSKTLKNSAEKINGIVVELKQGILKFKL